MTKKQIYIVAAFTLVVLAGVLVGIFAKKGEAPVSPGGPSGGVTATSTKSGGQPAFTSEVPKNAMPTTPALNIPIINQPSGSSVKNYKVFNVVASAAGYNPDEIVAKIGDEIEINLSASGGSFDMYSGNAGFLVSASEDKSGKITFFPSESGTYSFFCKNLCPRSGTITGKLIVLP